MGQVNIYAFSPMSGVPRALEIMANLGSTKTKLPFMEKSYNLKKKLE